MAVTTDQKSSRLFKALVGVSETKTIRDFFEEPIRTAPAILPNQVWQYGNWIPTGSASDPAGANAILAIQALNTDQQVYSVNVDESTSVSLVKRWIKRQLSMIDAGTNNSFRLLDTNGNPIQSIVPFNFGDGVSYNYNLYKSDGTTPIAFGIGDWVFDPNSGVLTFYNIAALSGVDAAHPPVMSFFQYIGGLGIPTTVSGYEGAILPITGYNGGANTTAWSDVNLDNAINLACNTVQPNFIATYGWKGTDTAEGVAVSFEKLIPMNYSHSKDPVKTGFGTEASEVLAVISRRTASVNLSNISGLFIDFLSEGTPVGTSVRVHYTEATGALKMSFDNGVSWGPDISGINTIALQSAVKVKNGSEFVVVRRIPGLLPTSDQFDNITVTDQTTKAGLFAWSTAANDFLPYVNTDASSLFDFGFPIVLKLGKIPPSMKLGATSSSGYSDIITPEYYGTRPTSIILAVQDKTTAANSTTSPDGSDYIVTNTTGGYLNDIIAAIYNTNPNFVGEVVLRQGRYKLNSGITFSGTAGIKIKGEAPEACIIDANGSARTISVQSATLENDVFFNDVLFSGTFNIDTVQTATAPAMIFMRGILGSAVNINITDGCGAVVTDCPVLGNLTVAGTATVLRSFESSSFGVVTLTGSGVRLHGCVINELIGSVGTNNIVAVNQIATLTSLNENNQYIGNSVVSYGTSVTAKFKMTSGKFEIIDTDGTRRWTGFSGPIFYNATSKMVELSYDTTTLSVDGNGKLTVNASANLISFNNVGVVRADGTPVTAANVQNALVDIYLHKADLDSGGKLNVNQMPASVTSGGLIYKGMWEFDAHAGAYPTAVDLGGTLMPGWFVLVSASNSASNPAGPQTAVDSQVYTAGDWAVYEAVDTWQRVDNSYADASYAILPSTPPDGQWTDGLLALGGTTIVEATDQINEILAKLAPPKPVNLSAMTLAFKTASTYTALEAGSGTSRSAVVNVTQPAVTTPTGTDSVNTLFFDGEAGTLTAYIDGVASGAKVLSAASDVGVTGSLNIVADNDPWAGTAGKQNFWKGLRAEIDLASALALGVHSVHLTHTSSGSTPDFTFYVDDPAATMSITGSSLTTTPPMSKYLSGVPSVQPSAAFVISAFTAVGVVGQFYNSTKIAAVTCNVSGVSSVSCTASSIPALPTAGTYGDAASASKTINMPSSAYSESINFVLTPYNSKSVAGTTTTLTSGTRIDTTTETERSLSGDPTDKYPAIDTGAGCGATFDSTQSLVGTYTGELQKINGAYRWPANTYVAFIGSNGAGPDYVSAGGAAISGESGAWRWATFYFPAAFSNNSAFTITFNGASGFSADSNQITAGLLLFAKTTGASGTGWLNGNAAYSGAGTPALDNDAAMVAGSSTASAKRITFGPVVRTGDLYVRVGISQASGIQFSGVSIGSLA